jgi:hypothetical protein
VTDDEQKRWETFEGLVGIELAEIRAQRGGLRFPAPGTGASDKEVATPGTQKPMVTREQYERARKVLDALPPGVYCKCSNCGQWKRNGRTTFRQDQVLCEDCA